MKVRESIDYFAMKRYKSYASKNIDKSEDQSKSKKDTGHLNPNSLFFKK